MLFHCCMPIFHVYYLRILLFFNLLFTERKGRLCCISVTISKGRNLLRFFLVNMKNLDICLYMNHTKLCLYSLYIMAFYLTFSGKCFQGS